MQHHVRATLHAARPHLSALWMKQGQHLGRSIPPVFMRLTLGSPLLLPAITCYWLCFIWPGFIFSPHRKSEFRPFRISSLDQLFFGPASGSTTLTTSPFLRLRFEVPVSH